MFDKSTTMGATGSAELLTFPEHLSSTRRFFHAVLVDTLSFYPFPFTHCLVCLSWNYGFWLPFWHLQTFCIRPCILYYFTGKL